MSLRRDVLTRTVRAPAKLNLILDVFGRRGDGFHSVETLMVPVRLEDTVSLTPLYPEECSSSTDIRLRVEIAAPLNTGPVSGAIPLGRENLVVRALKLLQSRSGCNLGAQVELIKRIPTAAGLGGASSDAAAALRLANRAWGIQWPNSKLAELGAEIGSDVPFFLYHRAAVCRGRGEQIERLPPIARLDVVIVKPPVEFSTADVYRAFDELPGASKQQFETLPASLSLGPKLLAHRMRNSLQRAASTLSPWVERLRMAFAELDFLGHQLTGSGSAYFGICRHAQHARRLATILRLKQLGLVYTTRSYP